METDPVVLAWWRRLITEARQGNEQPFLFAFTHPVTEINTRKLDANGKRIVEYKWNAVPGEVRQEIVDLLVGIKTSRGKRRAIDAGTAGVIRHLLHEMNVAEGMTKKQSIASLASRFGVSVGTIGDVIACRKTYALNRPELKDKRKLRRKN